jgi:NAD(P)-dependent dehydrogenase (short-subunit alcohol dehydrogenase family)
VLRPLPAAPAKNPADRGGKRDPEAATPVSSVVNAVLTGGSGGIGVATAALLAEQGVRRIIINGRDADRGNRACAEISRRAPGASVLFVAADVSNADGAGELFRRVAALLDEPLSVLVNCTGGDFAPELFRQTTADEIDGVVRHWLSSRLHCCRAGLPLMTKGSVIVNVASDAAKVPTPGEAVIGAAMAAIVMFSRTLALEVKREGIRVHAVTPSIVEGARLRARIAAGGFGGKLFEKAAAAAHLGVATERDVAEVIAFLASGRAARMTGQVISINGGISAG